jgi:hypothetical protein
VERFGDLTEMGRLTMKKKRGGGKGAKAPYQPPQVARVGLRPEEAVLGHCKTAHTGGPGTGSLGNCGFCKTVGS